jgi:hypothetical protein
MVVISDTVQSYRSLRFLCFFGNHQQVTLRTSFITPLLPDYLEGEGAGIEGGNKR